MRDYQSRKTKYILPRAVYHRTLWRIRDYYRMKQMAEDLLEQSSSVSDGQPRSHDLSKPVERLAEKREKFLSEVQVIDETLCRIPFEYRTGVWNNIQFGQAFPSDAGRATYSRYKSKFIYLMAERYEFF